MNLDARLAGSNPAFFQNELARLQTFINWPNPAVRPEDLAKAGFVYVKNDEVQCVYCKGILGSWEVGDVPLEEHRRHFPGCPFVATGTPPYQIAGPSGGIDVAGNGRPPWASQAKKKSVLMNTNIIRHQPPKHKAYGLLHNRVRSFDSWPADVHLPQNSICMAEAGFFYTGAGDQVFCFHCGQGLKNWEENDDPWEEHARWHPTCELVLLKKGQAYVEKVTRNPSASIEIKGNGFHLDHLTNGGVSKSADDREYFDDFMALPISQEILEMGMDKSEIEKALKERPKNSKLADIAMSLMEKAKMKAGSKSPLASNHTELLEETNETKEQELRSCIVCLTQDRCVTFLPCGHFSTCADCTLMLSDCPVCRQSIETIVKTYMS